jgi:hypothetical protein
MKMYWGSECIAPRLLDLGTRWRWAVSFTPLPLYPQGKSPWYSLDRRLGGPQSRSGPGDEEKNSQPPAENRIIEPRSSAQCLSPYLSFTFRSAKSPITQNESFWRLVIVTEWRWYGISLRFNIAVFFSPWVPRPWLVRRMTHAVPVCFWIGAQFSQLLTAQTETPVAAPPKYHAVNLINKGFLTPFLHAVICYGGRHVLIWWGYPLLRGRSITFTPQAGRLEGAKIDGN